MARSLLLASFALWAGCASAQNPAAPAEQNGQQPHGKVLYQSHGEPPEAAPKAPGTPSPQKEATGQPQITDAERSAVAITRYDLDIRLTQARSELAGRARLTVKNTGEKPLTRIALQLSSTLRWQNAEVIGAGGKAGMRLPMVQHRLDTDADHTGQANEALLTLPNALEPGGLVEIELFYAGTVMASGGRLERLGATPRLALATDWDSITPDGTWLRGFGNVLWFPVAEPQLFLSDNTLVPAIGRERLEHADVPVHLRLSVEYTGEAPVAAYFCARRQPLKPLQDDSSAPVAYGSGIATADFPAQPIGIRPISLFVIDAPEAAIAPLPVARSANPNATAIQEGTPMLAAQTSDEAGLPALAASAERIAPLLQQWLGPRPISALTILDHSGQAFQDGPLVVASVKGLAAPEAEPALASSLAHAWIQTGQPWMDEGLGQFFSLLWIEREKGRDAAVAALDSLMQPVAAAENPAQPGTEPAGEGETSSSSSQTQAEGQPLIAAYDEVFVRRKAAAVWWMLRDVAGDQPLQIALSAWRTQARSNDSPEEQARAFESLLEKTSGKDLSWFFNDWVLHDRGLPSLSIVDVTPRQLSAGAGHDAGWLVAVTMHNSGGAVADVPLVIRSGTFSTTKRVRIPGGQNVTERVVVEALPTEVVLNDGSTPEAGPSTHTRTVTVRTEQP